MNPLERITVLTVEDWQSFKALRLESLQRDPLAFGRAYEEELVFSDKEWQERFLDTKKITYGLWEEKSLIGTAGVKFETAQRFQHLATIIGVYTRSEFRGRGIAKKLLERILGDLKRTRRITKVKLNVTTTQETAINLYKSLGFEIIGAAKKEMRIGEEYYDEYYMELLF